MNGVKHYYKFFVALLLILMLTIEITSATQKSQIIDEAPHIVAGYSYLKTGDFRLNPEHPPLIKMMSGFPLLFMNLKPLDENPGWEDAKQWYAGQQFLYRNNVGPAWQLFWARLPIMLLSILLGLIIFKWSKRLFGVTGGLLALAFYAFDPTTIAHSRWITTDLGIAFFMFATLFFLSRYLKKPTFWRALSFAAIFGLAQVAKFSAIILIPLAFLYLIIAKWQGWPKTELNPDEIGKVFSIKKLILLTFIVAFFVIWGTYGFEMKTPYSDPEVSVAFASGKSQQHFDKAWLTFINTATDTDTSLGKFTENAAKNVPIPAFTYFKGFATLANHNYWGHTSYLLGEHSGVGWWYYFIIAFLVKTPLVTLLLLLFLIGYFIRWLVLRSKKVNTDRGDPVEEKPAPSGLIKSLRQANIDWYIIILTPLLYFIWTLTSKLNLGVRHLLPIYPFIFLMIGFLVTLKIDKYKKVFYSIFVVLLIFYFVSSLLIYPHYLSYFNEAVGGPNNGHKYLTDSNLDWGQDLYGLKGYMDKHGLDNIYLHYFGTAYPSAYGIDFESPPDNEAIAKDPAFTGTIAISVSALYSESKEYYWLLDHEITAKIGYSIWIYDIK